MAHKYYINFVTSSPVFLYIVVTKVNTKHCWCRLVSACSRRMGLKCVAIKFCQEIHLYFFVLSTYVHSGSERRKQIGTCEQLWRCIRGVKIKYLTTALNAGEWLSACCCQLNLRGTIPNTHWLHDQTGLKAVLYNPLKRYGIPTIQFMVLYFVTYTVFRF